MQLALVSVHPGAGDSAARCKAGRGATGIVVSSVSSSPKLEYCAAESSEKDEAVITSSSLSQSQRTTGCASCWLPKGIRRERIAILNAEEAPTALSRQVIAEKFNGTPADSGRSSGNVEVRRECALLIDVVIANSVAYEGTDLHIRTCMVHQHGSAVGTCDPAAAQRARSAARKYAGRHRDPVLRLAGLYRRSTACHHPWQAHTG
jgi:hypothetical protein